MVLRQRNKKIYRSLKNKKKIFRLKISDIGYDRIGKNWKSYL